MTPSILSSRIGYAAPTLILLKHIEADGSTHIFGGFSSCEWIDGHDYFGNSDSFLFSLIPKFQIYGADLQAGGRNYLYFNSRRIGPKKLATNIRVGLGFGGSKTTKPRLWIDEEMETDCFTTPEDNTYRKGFITEPRINKLMVNLFQVRSYS